MTLEEMKTRLKTLSARLGELAPKVADDTLSADEDAELDRLTAEFNDLGPKLERLGALESTRQRADAERERLERATASAGRVAGVEALGSVTGTPAGASGQGAAGGRGEIRQTVGERFASSEAVKNWLAAGGAKPSERVNYSRLIGEDAGAGSFYDGSGPIDRYALVATGTPAYLVPPMVVPGIFRGADYALTARDVLMGGRTNSDTIYFLRELLFTNTATEVAQATATSGGSGSKPESTLTFEQDHAPVVTIAHWIPITRQAIADAAQLQTMVENRLLVGLERRFNSQVWNGAGGGTNMTGILNTSGIQLLDGDYFADDPTLNESNSNANFDRVLRAATEIDLTGDAQATFFAMNPRDLEKFLTVTDTIGRYLGGGPFTAPGPRSLWGYSIAADRAITEGTVIAGDGSMAAIWDREDANILIDTIDDQFTRNMLTILAEMRAALTVFRPAAFAVVTLADWS